MQRNTYIINILLKNKAKLFFNNLAYIVSKDKEFRTYPPNSSPSIFEFETLELFPFEIPFELVKF